MQVIPSINGRDFDEVKKQVEIVRGIFKKVRLRLSKIRVAEGDSADLGKLDSQPWLHFDVGDGIFSSVKSWGNPVRLKEIINLRMSNVGFSVEVHLMVENPENTAEAWLRELQNFHNRRLIVHLESLINFARIMDLCQKYRTELMLAINPATIVENLIPYFHNIKYFLILAVQPGKSGQKFQREILEKIEFLRERVPDAKIEVDGGVNVKVAELVKGAGADMIASASYIFNDANPKKAYEELEKV